MRPRCVRQCAGTDSSVGVQGKQVPAEESEELPRCSVTLDAKDHFMAAYKRFIPQPSLCGATPNAVGLDWRLAYGLRKSAKRPQAATLADWEEEGGRLATPAISPQSS
jgi:hypothetical protein